MERPEPEADSPYRHAEIPRGIGGTDAKRGLPKGGVGATIFLPRREATPVRGKL